MIIERKWANVYRPPTVYSSPEHTDELLLLIHADLATAEREKSEARIGLLALDFEDGEIVAATAISDKPRQYDRFTRPGDRDLDI